MAASDRDSRHDDPAAKLVAGIERLGHVQRLLLWEQGRAAHEQGGLSPVQAQTLVFLSSHDAHRARVGELAREFMLTPATVSDAVSTLERKGLVEKRRDDADRRVVVLALTKAGVAAAEALADWSAPVLEALREEDPEELVAAMTLVQRMIARLQEAGIVQTARMCITCTHFREDAHRDAAAPHHCSLIDVPLAPAHLRIDCPEHEPAPTSGDARAGAEWSEGSGGG